MEKIMNKSLFLTLLLSPVVTFGVASELSYPQRMYAEGFDAFEQGNIQLAKNSWTKYTAYCRLSPDDCVLQDQKNVRTTLTLLAPASTPTLEEKIAPAPEIAPLPQKKVERPSKPVRVTSTTKIKVDVSRLVRRAEAAKEQSQLEDALRMYQLAETVNPETEEFKKEIEELQKLME
jgi:hypothetical protein